MLKITVSFFYLINPMFTFYLANLQIVMDFLVREATDLQKINIPLAFGLKADFKLSIAMFMFQFVFYLSLVMILDHRRAN